MKPAPPTREPRKTRTPPADARVRGIAARLLVPADELAVLRIWGLDNDVHEADVYCVCFSASGAIESECTHFMYVRHPDGTYTLREDYSAKVLGRGALPEMLTLLAERIGLSPSSPDEP